MNKKTLGIILTAFVIGTMIVLTVKSNLQETEPIEEVTGLVDEQVGFLEGDTLPDFELETLSGDLVKLSDYKGQKVILNFWASWCGPCKAEMPHMENYYKKSKEEDNVEIIAVNLMGEERKGIKGIEEFVSAYGLTFPVPLDTDGLVMDTYEILAIPTTYFLNTDGTIAHKLMKPMDEKTIKSYVDSLN
ncbi:redoxin domain-containing protein [Sporosarcina sp. G11-34]|uniref:redoxin domain-containing protein n=1 Tax=Sporosarcina sp. G11-34 TaxID=2849605 RepID=UPI0022A950FC|nr:redoxin domain-containing protein [Sporosarcina sp. G11-34]MCZ2259022.1 redoxin domain-containing protein [Sporosarcina sp. G11-34]